MEIPGVWFGRGIFGGVNQLVWGSVLALLVCARELGEIIQTVPIKWHKLNFWSCVLSVCNFLGMYVLWEGTTDACS